MTNNRFEGIPRVPEGQGLRELYSELLRSRQLDVRVALMAALYGNDAMRAATHGYQQLEGAPLTSEQMDHVFQLVFGQIVLPPRTREFLSNIVQHDLEARDTLNHYELVQEGDMPPPDSATALKALMDDLRVNSNHREAIHQMHRPVFQLIPIYKHEGVGFQRMVNAIDAHRIQALGQQETRVVDELFEGWGMDAEVPGDIVRWRVAVTEGAKFLGSERNRFPVATIGRFQQIGDPVHEWQQYCENHGLQLCGKEAYALLQMQEIRQAIPGVVVRSLGVDPGDVTILGDKIPSEDSLLPLGGWIRNSVHFRAVHTDYRNHASYDFLFRPSVVVNLP